MRDNENIIKYQEEFNLANSLLKSYDGELCWSDKKFELFIFKSNKVRLVFYPHKSNAGNVNIRVRDGGSKDKTKSALIMEQLHSHAIHDDNLRAKYGLIFRKNNQSIDYGYR